MMESVFTVTAEDFPDAIIDTRYDLRIVGLTLENALPVMTKVTMLYGKKGFSVKDGEVYIKGDSSLFKPRYSDGDLAHVMKRLTAEDGCPWDRAQTHDSIRINAVEEAYELCDAIDNRDIPNIKEEIGDLLLQAVFHADIADRKDEFTWLDVVDGLVRKLVTRHTHIFGDNKAVNPEEALKHWEAAKAVEKSASGLDQQLARIPQSFPALLRTQKIIKKLVKDGLVNDCECKTATDLLSAVCGCVQSGIDPEVELSRALEKLVKRYRQGRLNAISDFEDSDE